MSLPGAPHIRVVCECVGVSAIPLLGATVELSRGLASSLCAQFPEHMLTADLDFALVFSDLCEIIGKLHP